MSVETDLARAWAPPEHELSGWIASLPHLPIEVPRGLVAPLIDEAAAEGLTVAQLLSVKLAVPLDQLARVRPISCHTCGRPWIDHDPACARHRWRPAWARVLDGERGGAG